MLNPILNHNQFFVKEHVGMFKAANEFDIYDPASSQIILECREQVTGISKLLRFTDYKRMTPFRIEIKLPTGKTLITVKRGWTFFRSVVDVLDENGQPAGSFRQRMMSIGGKFDVMNAKGDVLCTLNGKILGWEFKFTNENQEYAQVTKKWSGMGKELFTSADNYIVNISHTVKADDPIRVLILAAVMCIDLVLKE